VISVYYTALLTGRITRLACPYVPFVCLPVHPLVRPVRVPYSKTRRRRKKTVGVNVPRTGVTDVPICSSKGHRSGNSGYGHIICRYRAHIM